MSYQLGADINPKKIETPIKKLTDEIIRDKLTRPSTGFCFGFFSCLIPGPARVPRESTGTHKMAETIETMQICKVSRIPLDFPRESRASSGAGQKNKM